MKNVIMALISALLILGCSDSMPTTQINVTPLSEIKGNKVMLEMCGMNISLPKKFITYITTDSVQGISSGPVKETYMHIKMADFSGKTNEEITPTVLGVIYCNERKNNRIYSIGNVSLTDRLNLPDIGLSQFKLANPGNRLANTYYIPLDDAEALDGFFMLCQMTSKNNQPNFCEINGYIHTKLGFRVNFGVGDTLKNWRIYKHSFEKFVQIEERH